MKKLDFLPNLKNKYSIRKFTVGTASILIGSLLFLGHGGDAQAAEDTNNDSVAEVSADNSETQQSSQEIEKVTTETTPQDVSEDKVESPLEKDKSQEASQVENQPTSDEEVSSSAKEPEKAASKELSSDKKDEVQSSNNTKVQQEQSVSKETIQPETESKPKEDTIITEKKATDSSQPVQKEETDQVASQEDKVVEPVKSNKFETLTTEQKVEKVKAELGSEHEEAAINEALGKIDAENLSSEQIKGEILKLLVKQGSAQRDLYSPQATLNNSEENEPKYAVRAFQVDTSAKDQVVVTKDNFNDYFWTIDDASYDEKTGIATLTPDEPSKKGAISLDTKLNINKDFHFSGAINLGDKGEGHKKDGVIAGGDGIGFMFNPGKVHDLGLYGAGLGFGGLPFSFGFKFDTFVNTGYDRNGKAQQDPVQFNNKGAFGAFVYANGGGDVITQQGSGTFKAELLKEQPQDNKFVDLTIDYDADTQVMTINYGGQEWSQKMTSYFNYTKKKVYALAIGASTGGAHNLQQVRIDKFTYTASALLEEDYVDQDTQELIGTPLRTSGDIDEVITLIERPDYLTKKGYELVSKDTRLAPDYNSANNSVKLTNASQFIVYTVKDIEAPKIEDIANVSSNVSEVINPIKLNITDNSGHFKSKTVTGLPEGLTFNETTNEITGTPTKIGTSTVTITATDNANLSTTKTFTYTVADAVAPEITAVENKTSEAYTPITPISLTATDNSGAVPTLEVTGLPAGLSYDDKTKQITGTPTAVGQSEVTIKATDAANNSSTTKFSFTVEANKALEALKQAVQEAKGLDKTPYTPDSVQALNNKVAEGDQLVAHPENGSSDLFKQKTDEINQAKAQLSTEADKTELNKAIEKAGTLGQLNDADKEDKAVKDKLTTANEVKANKNATKDQVDAATNDLNTAINDKLYHDALDRLNAAINDAKTVNQSEYTPSTVAPFSKALTDGEAKAADKTATPDQLDKAAKAITDAKAQLQHAADKQALEAAINKAKALGALNEADKEDKGVKDALTSGETVKNNNNASQQQVADATKALNDAIEAKEHADALDALKAKLAEVAGLDKATYTPNTVTPLNLKEEAGKAVVAAEKSKTTDEIKAATEALTNAQNGLVKKANKADLEKAITKAEGFTQLNPQKPMDKQLQDALTAAKAVDADDNATQQATDTNKDQLNEAILEKERADAFERLQAAVAKGAQVASSEGFTPDSVQKVKDVIQEVNPLVMASMSDDPAEKGKYDVAAIDAATQKINDSVDALVKKADKTELQKAIDRAGTLGALEAADKEDKAVQDKLTAANQVKDNGNATPQEVTNATNELNQAIDQKLYQDALDELNAAIKDGEGLDKTAYTPDSVTPFEASINAGKTKAADKNATPDQLKAATQAIKDAKDALKQKANKDGLNNSITAAEALQPLQPGNLLDDAVKNALDKAKAVQGNDNAAQPAVDAAKTELDNAVNAKKAQDAKDAAAKQAALDELKAELAKVAKIDKNNFTPDTVTPLTEKEAAGQAIVNAPQDKTVEEIKEATKALQDAEKALQAKSDKAALQAAIDKAEAIKDLNPADVEDKAVQDKLAEAKAVKNNDNASQQAVQDATKALNDAVAAKEHADALDALKAELKKVEGLNKDTYTPDSVTPLTEKETEGKAIVAAPDTKSTDEIKKATDALKAAEAGLVNKANKEELQKAIDKADALKGLDAADKEDKAVQDKLAEAKTVKANDNATPEQVQNATKALNDAVAAKERQDALDELQKALDDAAKVKQEDYKPNTVAPFEAAIKAGETAKADTAKTPAELKEAAKAINDAKNALQAKANKDGLNTSIQTAEGLQPLVTGDAEDDAVKAALEKAKTVQANQNADQPAVDAAKAELDNAIKAKQDQDAKEKADAAKAKEDALKELQAELEKVAKIDKNKYTPDSVTPLTEKQSAGQAIVDGPAAKTTEEIKAATQALKDAEKALQPKSDKAALEAAIDKAIALGDLDENDKEDKAVKDALTAGQVVDGDGNATPEQVQNATKALNDALAAKERQDALDELQKALDDAAKVKQVDYKPNTVAPFEAAIKAGETAKADAAKTPEELKAAAKAIKDAQAALQAKADKAELDKSVTAAEALQPLKAGDPEDDAVKTALEKAKEVQANQNADQPTVDAAKEALDNAVNAKKAADAKEAAEAADAAKAKENALDELKAELAKVEKLNKDDYTPNTVNPLNEKETAGKGIVANPDDKTADEIKAATDALKAAEAGLVNKANKEELQKAIDKAEALKDLDAADTEDKAVQDKLAEAQTVKANDNATPEQVQAATQALNDAVAAKERQDALDELQKALDAANAINKDAYTPNSVAPLDSAVKAGETAKADAAKTPEELKEAAKAIKDAQAALQAKADKAELDKAVTTAEGLGNLDPADAEDKAVKDALDKAKEVQANQNADQPTVDAAKEALNKAIDAKKAADAKEQAEVAKAKEDALKELQAELDKVAKIDKNNFTPDTVTPLTNKEDEGKAIIAAPDAKSTEEIKAATQALKDAENALQAKSDKAALQAAIDKAEALKDLDAADTEDKAVQDKLAEAQTVKANDNATPEQVQNATKALNDALAAKERQDALDELQKALDAANAVNKEAYTPNSVAPLDGAVKAGETAKADATKTPEELKAAAKAINDAKDALQAKADKAELDKAVTTAEGLGNLDPADAEDKAVQDALNKAKEVQADQNADQPAVDAAKEALNKAIDAKKAADTKEQVDAAKAKQDALDALKAELAKVKALDKDTFTPNTVAPLNEKEAAGDAAVADADNKSIDEIKEATQALKDAETGLVKRADKGDLEKAIDKAEALGQLDPADAEDKAVQDAVIAGQTVKDNANATPEQVAKATKDINDAVAAKERQDALDELNKAIDAANALDKDTFTPETVSPLEDAVKDGEAIRNDLTKRPEELKDAALEIQEAIKALHAKANKDGLNNSIQTAEGLGNLNPADAEDKAVQDALDKAKEVQADQNANQTAVDKAKEDLDNAIKAKQDQDAKEKADTAKAKQDALDALKAELAKVKALDKDAYTPDTVTPLNEKETAGDAVVANADNKSIDEIKDATQALKDAEAGLVKRADKGDLEKAIEKANALGQLDAADAEDKAVKDAVTAGQTVKDNANATPEQVAKATKDINDAVAAKERQDALDELNKAIDAAQNIEKADYTAQSVEPLDKAKEAGQKLAADNQATPEQLKEAAKLINDAINQLVPDKAELAKQIEAAKAFEPLNDTATDQLLKHALDAAVAVQNNPNATPQEIKEATWNLEDEIANKIAADAIEALKNAVNKANALKEEKYTPNSYAPLKTATTEGQSILDDPSSADVPTTLAKAKEINQLIDALKEKADKTALETALDKAVAFENLDDKDAEDKAVHDALLAGQEVEGDLNATPEEVQKATEDLNNALAAKEHADALDELNKALEAAKAVTKDNFTPDSVKPLEEAVKAGETTQADAANKTPDELKEAAKAINDAKDALKAKADKDGLNTSIQTAEGLGNLDPADAEDKAVKDALDKAKAVQANQNADQPTVDAAKAELDNASKAKQDQDAKEKAEAAKAKLDALDALKAELEKVAQINKDNFTPASVTPLTNKEDEGKAIVAAPDAKSTEEIKAATQALKDAEKALQAKSDKAALQAAINKAETLKDLNPADTEDKAVQDKLAEAHTVKSDDNATPEQVQEATQALNDALAAKEHADALDELNKAIDAANAVAKDSFTPDSVKPLEEAVKAGETVKADAANKTPEELKAAAKVINDAKDALKAKADKGGLNTSIQTAEGLGNLDSADAEDKAVKDALDKAKAVQADQNADQTAVDKAKAELDNAIKVKQDQDAKEKADAAKAKQDALDALKAELAKVEKLNKDDFTPNSVAPLNEKETAGKAIVADADNKSIDEIKEATQALKDAENALVKRADKSELDKAVIAAEGLGDLDTADSEDKAVKDALDKAKEVQANLNATQAEVDEAKDALNKAIQAKADQDKADAVNTALEALKAELEKAKAVNEDNYTPNSVKPLAEAANTGQAIVDAPTSKTVEEINKAAQAVKDALADLQAKANKAELEKAIEKAENINSFDPGDAEDAAVLEALSNAKEVEADANATQAEVDAAKDALNKAIQAKANQDKADQAQADAVNSALDALKAELEKAKAVNKDNYTPNSVKPLTEAANTGQAIVDVPTGKTVEEINKATQAVKDALAGLQAKADKTELGKAIEKAESINSFDPGDAEDAAVLEALSNAKEVEADANATQAEVDATKDALNKAIQAKADQDKADRAQADAVNTALDALKAELEKAKAANKDNYTPNSVKPLTEAANTGQAIVDAPTGKTVEEINKAAQAVKDALAGLQAKADKAELGKSIEKAESINSFDPGDAEDAAVLEALSNAKEVEADANATQAEVDAAKDALNKAIQAKADQDKADALAELQKALDKAKATDKTNCTPESVKNLDDAINKGQEVVNHSNEVSIDSIKAAEKAIQDALKALEVDKASDSGKDTENVKRPTVKAVEKTSDKVNKKSEGSKAETKAKSKELPKTGLESPVDPKYATLMFAIGGLMALFGRRKKEDKDSTEK